MIRFLNFIFLLMFAYGAIVGPIGAALIALGMIALCNFADEHFALQDKKWAQDPMNAPCLKCDTLQDLDQHECECMRTKDRV